MGKYALLIGVGEYGEGLPPLPAAPNDVAAFGEVLQKPDMGGFDEVKRVLDPTQAAMAREIELWFQGREPDDLVVLFFSGHGVKDDRRRLYFAAKNTEKHHNRLVRSTATSARFVSECIRSCKSNYQVIILDCCFSGAFGDVLPKDDGGVDLKEQLGAEGRVVLTSTSSVDYSFQEKESDLSVYTRYLVEGIASGAADEDGDGFISVEELHHYADRKVAEVSPAMNPEIIILKDEGYRIRLARSPKDDPKLKYRKEVEKRVWKGNFNPAAKRLLASFRLQLGVSNQDAETIEAEVIKPYQDYQRKLKDYGEALQACLQEEETLSTIMLRDLTDFRVHLGLKADDVGAIERKWVGCTLEDYESRVEQQRQEQAKADYENKRQQYREHFIQALQAGYPLDQAVIDGLKTLQQQLGLSAGDVAEIERPLREPAAAKYQQELREREKADRKQREADEARRKQQEAEEAGRQRREAEAKRREQTFEYEVVTVNAQGQVAKRQKHQAEYAREALGNGVSLDLVKIPGGTFQMGSPKNESERRDSEGPQHSVTVPGFWMGKFPVTQAQWRAVASFTKVEYDLDSDPSKFKGDDRPVEQISWHDAMEFCARLSQKTGREHRLPSEAEWEYACRAGTTTPFHFGATITPELANYRGNSTYGDGPKGVYREETTPVGSFQAANAFGLYDMHGNVWEWCLDHWHENYGGFFKKAPTDGSAWTTGGDKSYRLLRGGSWDYDPDNCRAAYRLRFNPDYWYDLVGLRVVRVSARTS